MGKKRGEKSQAVRNFLQENPKAKAKEVVQALGAKGIKVTANLVYFLKGAAKSTKKRQLKRQARKEKAAALVSNKGDVVGLIHDVRALAHRVGGYGKLRELVDALAG
jgi:hypothetical protein